MRMMERGKREREREVKCNVGTKKRRREAEGLRKSRDGERKGND